MKLQAMLACAAATLVTGCGVYRSQVADDAKQQMVGMKSEQVLACMGPPINRMAQGATEVWAYTSSSGSSSTIASVSGNRYGATGISSTARGFCNINVVMTNGTVSQVNYSSPNGGLIGPNEQCVFAVENCVKPR